MNDPKYIIPQFNIPDPQIDKGFCDAIMIPFYMDRLHDHSNVSGVGIVAQGMISTLSGEVFTVWQSDHPSFTVHRSLQSAISIHGHNGSTKFVLATESTIDDRDREDFLPSSFEMIHTQNKNNLSRIGVVGRGVITNNGGTIFQWLVTPYQIEYFASMESFWSIHVANRDYVNIHQIDRYSFVTRMPYKMP